MIFWCSISGAICYEVFSFPRLAISATRFMVVFHIFQNCTICRFSTYHHELRKKNIITKLQKLCSLSRNLRVSNKSHVLFLRKPLCTGDLLPAYKIFFERPDTKTFSRVDKLVTFRTVNPKHDDWSKCSGRHT